MRFWDTSGLVPMLITEKESPEIGQLFRDDPGVFVWWGTYTECVSALARRLRAAEIDQATSDAPVRRLARLHAGWREVAPGQHVRNGATELLFKHALRAADSFQLAAALVAADGQPGALPFVTLDPRLGDAARAEGFRILP